MTKKSVCIIAEVEKGYGVKSYEFAQQIVRQGHSVELVSCKFDVFGDSQYDDLNENIKLIHSPLSVYDKKYRLADWKHFLKDIKSSIVIIQRSSMFFGTHAFLLACRRHFKKVYFIQRYPDGPMPAKKLKPYCGGLLKVPELWWYKERLNRSLKSLYADRIIAISNFMKDHLVKEWAFPSRKIECVMNGINWQSFARNNALGRKFREQFNIALPAIVFGILARLSPEKGIDVALEAFALLIAQYPMESLFLVIVGNGSEYEKLVKMTKRLHLEKVVIFCGHMPDPRPALSGIDILLAPTRSKMEAFGLSVAEGMAAGCLPIVSTEGGMAEIVNSSACGLRVQPEDPNALFQAMQKTIIMSDSEKEYMRLNALNRIKEHFDAETNYKKILSVLKI